MPALTAEISGAALDTLRWLVEQTDSSEAGVLESAINNYRRQLHLIKYIDRLNCS